ncbi:holin, BlyA family-containing protein (plasmid) [Borrelia miyamotoi]|uniref:Holin, BlyA family-containing protein n=1 Tax=Borrelia miyamotoi TaxID=47466 RepID=A0AAX3JNV4_9SPIR|nr:holin, BlyA family-containing protein [Borrelia miyamotoi]QFP42331.1 holin, BlyA family-containing protein [Borrelia miyamotoi]QFP48451.1 holin, BlyA family-containing protein [Borrelia miyamotoi]WAZ72349.1 holin, BlyA family-containing protein [Borrelia miyamotoi]
MNRLFNFLSNIDETKLMITGGITIFILITFIPLTIILSPIVKDTTKTIKYLILKIINKN